MRVLEGLETALFKQFFDAWNEREGEEDYSPSHVAEWKIDDLHTQNRRRVERAAGTAPGFLPDDGTGIGTFNWNICILYPSRDSNLNLVSKAVNCSLDSELGKPQKKVPPIRPYPPPLELNGHQNFFFIFYFLVLK